MLQNCTHSTQLFEINDSATAYSFVLLPAHFLEIVAVHLSTQVCYHGMYILYQLSFSFNQLDNLIKSEFTNNKQLFQAIKTSKSKCIELSKLNNGTLTVNFEINQKLHSIDFNLQPKTATILPYNNPQIVELKKRLEIVCTENKQLFIENQKKDQEITQLQIEIRLNKKNLEAVNTQLKRLEREFKEREFRERQEEAFVTEIPLKMTFKVPLQSIDYNLEKISSEKLNLFTFTPYQTQHLKHFKIEGKSITLIHQFKDPYQVVSEQFIPLTGKTKISIKAINSRQNKIYFGVIKELRKKQKFTCQHKEALSYKLSGGKFLFEDGCQSGEQIESVKIGQTLTMSIDRPNKEVTWSIQQKYMIKRRIPPSMESEPLFMFVTLQHEGDQVQIS